ncbi:MAG: PilZ domain-containing protein [Candidatus Eremiobacteraeota bacterium]|nr:PilZ domain-containing protein [Candidatus Eremiobacteraeota bacterium]MCW5870535.1 PilZ domain-containing protein [Candidatus Eremiobacteraeota bacterium]
MGEQILAPNTEDNRRNNLRVSCNVPIRCELNGESFDGALKDVSPRGMRLELARRLARNEVLTISRPGVALKPVQAIVRWCRRHAHRDVLLAGLEVEMSAQDLEASWAQPILATFDFLHPVAIELIPEPVPLQLEEASEPAAPTVVQEPPPEPMTVPEIIHAEEIETSGPSVEEWNALLTQAQARLVDRPQPLFNKILKGFREFAFEDKASVEERRRVLRLTCLYETNLGRHSAEILDLSPAGLGLLTNRKLSRGTSLQVAAPAAYADFAPVDGLVRFCRPFRDRFRIGLEYRGSLIPTWANPALKDLGFMPAHLDQKRRYVRAQTSLPVEVRDWRGEFELATLLDLSRGGTLLRTTKSWEIGEALRLILGPIGYLPTLFLSGVVLHQRPDPDGWLVNLSFIDAGGTNLSRLDLYIKTILSRPQV